MHINNKLKICLIVQIFLKGVKLVFKVSYLFYFAVQSQYLFILLVLNGFSLPGPKLFVKISNDFDEGYFKDHVKNALITLKKCEQQLFFSIKIKCL